MEGVKSFLKKWLLISGVALVVLVTMVLYIGSLFEDGGKPPLSNQTVVEQSTTPSASKQLVAPTGESSTDAIVLGILAVVLMLFLAALVWKGRAKPTTLITVVLIIGCVFWIKSSNFMQIGENAGNALAGNEEKIIFDVREPSVHNLNLDQTHSQIRWTTTKIDVALEKEWRTVRIPPGKQLIADPVNKIVVEKINNTYVKMKSKSGEKVFIELEQRDIPKTKKTDATASVFFLYTAPYFGTESPNVPAATVRIPHAESIMKIPIMPHNMCCFPFVCASSLSAFAMYSKPPQRKTITATEIMSVINGKKIASLSRPTTERAAASTCCAYAIMRGEYYVLVVIRNNVRNILDCLCLRKSKP